ncbi:MAG: rRNA maturation RNase YbeY [Alphaproteobacteria bacterium]|nr:MAG: rRNA maturation RNase YbeY [Alphaproteobacteria bacterium]
MRGQARRKVRYEIATPIIDVRIDDPAWYDAMPDAAALAARAAAMALEAAGAIARVVEVAVVLSDDQAVAALNETYRGKTGATNVLSFPACDAVALTRLGEAAAPPVLLGDVVLARQTLVREAAAQGKAAGDHLMHLTVHGVLHLLGYDHEEDGEAERMEDMERRALARFGIDDPYARARR